MKNYLLTCLIIAVCVLMSQAVCAQITFGASDMAAARKARDAASIRDLQPIISTARKYAEGRKTAESYERLALLYVYLCEAAETHQQTGLFKKAAEDGVAAAEKAVELDPNSSNAHYLLGDLINQLIPHVFGGGMRLGKRAEDEMELALKLDPNNADAHVARAISYYYTPDTFGGSKTKAFEMLNRAVLLNPKEDTPHIWLSMFYLEANKKTEALSAIRAARKINPNRSFSKFVYKMVVDKEPAPARTGKSTAKGRN